MANRFTVNHQLMLDIQSFDNFEKATQVVLSFLHKRLGFGLWMVTRTEGQDWIVLQTEDHYYNVAQGAVFQWSDSFCSRMVIGLGPRIAPSAQSIPTYAAAPIAQQVLIGAYIGVPLLKDDGSLFGTLCAIDPHPKPTEIEQELPLIELLASLLSSILSRDLKAIEQTRHFEQVQQEALTDSLTSLLNRRGWNKHLQLEESRARLYGTPICIFSIDLDELKYTNDTFGHSAGDELIRQAAEALRSATRKTDILARVGGDEFAILGVECNPDCSEQLMSRLQEVLLSVGVKASIGKALRKPNLGLLETWQEADQQMYQEKAKRRYQSQPVCLHFSPPHCQISERFLTLKYT